MSIIFNRYKILIIFIACLLFGGLLGVIHNYYIEWDFLNHRFYLGYAYLNDRISVDVLPVLFRTSHSPFIDSVNYIIMNKLVNHKLLFLFISGLKYGLFLFLSFLLFDLILVKENKLKNFLLFSSLYLSAFSFFVLVANGYSHTDLQPASIVLLFILVYFKIILKELNLRNSFILFLSAFLLGIAIMFKYFIVIFALCIILLTLIFRKTIKSPYKTVSIISAGIIAGFFAIGAHRLYTLYLQFQNPFYPYFNNIFTSPMSDYFDILQIDFEHLRPKSILEFIFMPFLNSIKGCRGIEDGYLDLRIPFAFASLLIYLLIRLNKILLEKIQEVVNPLFFDFTALLIVICFYTNLFLFANYRYVLYLFPFISLFVIVIPYLIIPHFKYKKYYPLILIFLMFLTFVYSVFQINKFYLTIIFNLVVTFIFFLYFIYRLIIDKEEHNRNIYTIISLLVMIPLMTTYYTLSDIQITDFKEKIIYVEDLGFEDNSNVILGMARTSFVVPFQNPKAKYWGFAIPENFENSGYFWFSNECFKNKYLEKYMFKVFKEDKPLYFLCNFEMFKYDDKREIFEEFIRYYSNNQINDFSDCKVIKNTVLFNSPVFDAYVCKLK